jgi:hypothetical protein
LLASAEIPPKLYRPVKAGLETTLQLVPFQCSTKAPALLLPTAQTSFDETAVTPLRIVCSTVAVGRETTLQLLPFQCSINDSPKPGLADPNANPTAHTSLLAAAATP